MQQEQSVDALICAGQHSVSCGHTMCIPSEQCPAIDAPEYRSLELFLLVVRNPVIAVAPHHQSVGNLVKI